MDVEYESGMGETQEGEILVLFSTKGWGRSYSGLPLVGDLYLQKSCALSSSAFLPNMSVLRSL